MGSRLLTVTVVATSFDLTDLDTVKDELEIDDASADDRLSRYIAEASRAIASWCNRVFGKETVAETFRPGEVLETLVLARRPVVAITSVVENGITLTASDYELDADSGLIYRLCNDCRTVWSWAKIVVTYSAGYVLPAAAPPQLSDACIELVKLKQSAQTRDPLLRVEEVPGVLHQEYWVGGVGEGGVPQRVLSLIAPFRNVLV